MIVGNVPTSNLISEGGYLKCRMKKMISECGGEFSIEKGELYKFNQNLEKYASKSKDSKVIFIDPYKKLCRNERCIVRKGDKLFYSDHAHLSKWGAKLLAQEIIDKIYFNHNQAKSLTYEN